MTYKHIDSVLGAKVPIGHTRLECCYCKSDKICINETKCIGSRNGTVIKCACMSCEFFFSISFVTSCGSTICYVSERGAQDE